MTLSGGAIAGIAVVGALALILIAVVIYYVIKKRRQNAEYEDRCGRLWDKYGNSRPEVMAKFPYADATFVRTPVPGQQFTQRELNQEMERKPMLSMYTPINPEEINTSLYTESHQSGDEAGKSPMNPGIPSAQVYYSLEFDEKFSLLNVHIDQAKNLRPKSYTNMCDPYCTVTLLPEHTEKKSQVKRKTVDPLFQENFSFEVAKDEMQEKSVQIKFFDYDQYSRDECTGVVVQRLNELNLSTKVDLWGKVCPMEGQSSSTSSERAGDILLRLGYLPSAEKLTVVLLKARSLREVGPEDDRKPPDPYVRVAILHEGNLLKKKKTSTKRKTSNPTYNQAINFAVPLDVLPQVEIQFHVVHETGVKINRAERKEIIGSLEIGPHSRRDELEHWRDLMSNKPQARWHHLTISTHHDTSSVSGQSRDDSTSDTKSS